MKFFLSRNFPFRDLRSGERILTKARKKNTIKCNWINQGDKCRVTIFRGFVNTGKLLMTRHTHTHILPIKNDEERNQKYCHCAYKFCLFTHIIKWNIEWRNVKSIEMVIRVREDGVGENYLQHMEGIEKNITYIYVALSQLIQSSPLFVSIIIILMPTISHGLLRFS